MRLELFLFFLQEHARSCVLFTMQPDDSWVNYQLFTACQCCSYLVMVFFLLLVVYSCLMFFSGNSYVDLRM